MSWGTIAAAAAPAVASGIGGYLNQASSAKQAKKRNKKFKKLGKLLQEQRERARAANLQRANDIRARSEDLYGRTMKGLDSLSKQEAADINRQYTNLKAEGAQNLVSRGLGGTTVGDTVARGYESDRTGALNRSSDAIAQRRIDADVAMTDARNAFEERITDAYPEDDEIFNLQLELGMLPQQMETGGMDYQQIFGSLAQALGAVYQTGALGGTGTAKPTASETAQASPVSSLVPGAGGGADTGYALNQTKKDSTGTAKATPAASNGLGGLGEAASFGDAGAGKGVSAAGGFGLGSLTGSLQSKAMQKRRAKNPRAYQYASLAGGIGGSAFGPIGGIVGAQAAPYVYDLINRGFKL